MIDIENFEEGTVVWFAHNNQPISFIGVEVMKYVTTSGLQFNILGQNCDIPADLCYSSKIECIEAQINYWRDMRLNEIVKDNA